MAKTMAGLPAELRRILSDSEPIEAAVPRLSGGRVFLVGTGTSWHAANQGAFFLRLAGVNAPGRRRRGLLPRSARQGGLSQRQRSLARSRSIA